MTYGQPTDPRPGTPPYDGHPPQNGPGYAPQGGSVHLQQGEPGYAQQGGPGYPQQGGSGYPQHLWPDYAQARGQQRAPGQAAGPMAAGPIAARQPGSAVLGVVAVVLGLVAVVAPFLPMDMTGFRQYAAFPFAVPGLALAVAGLAGNRRGKPLAALGLLISLFAGALGAYMVLTY